MYVWILYVCMAKHVHFIVGDDEHERLKKIKEKHGLTWKGIALHAADDLENDE